MHVTLFTPDARYEQFRSVWEARIALYVDLLKSHDLTIEPVAWTDARPIRPAWAQLAWGYHLQPARWDLLLAEWPQDVPLVNAPSVLRWNSDKRYLNDLAASGVPIVPTSFVQLADEGEVAAARARFGTEQLVVKPRVSASAAGTSRVGPGDAAPRLADAMIQPFISSVQDQGELSIFFFAGERGHAVRKVAAAGDFRVQREYGGAFTPAQPDADQLAVAQAALAAAPELPLYARIDLVRDDGGAPRVMELELVEPDLYLDLAPDAGAGFAALLAGHFRTAC